MSEVRFSRGSIGGPAEDVGGFGVVGIAPVPAQLSHSK